MSYRHFRLSCAVVWGIFLISLHAQGVEINEKILGSLHISRSNEGYRNEPKKYQETFEKLFAQAQNLKRRVIYIPKFGHLSTEEFCDILIEKLNSFIQHNQKGWDLELRFIASDAATFQIFSQKFSSLDPQIATRISTQTIDIKDVMTDVYKNGDGHSDKITIFQPGQGGLCKTMDVHFEILQGLKSTELATMVQDTYKKIARNLGEGHLERNFPFVEIRPQGMAIQISETRKFNKMYETEFSRYDIKDKPFQLRHGTKELYAIPFIELADLFSKIEPKQTEEMFTSSFLIYGSPYLNATQRADALNQFFLMHDSKIAGNDINQIISRAFKDRSTGKIFKIPMVTPSGFTYEQDLIAKWVKKYNTDPMTGEPLTMDDLRANSFLRKAQDEFERGDDKRQDNLIRHAIGQLKQNEVVDNSVKIFLEAVRDYYLHRSQNASDAQKERYSANIKLIEIVFRQASILETPLTK